MVRIPTEYQEVEYLESTGTQWIDTGATLNNGCVITIDFSIDESTVNRVVYGWRRKGSYTNPYQFFIGANSQKVRYVAIGVSSYINSSSSKYGHIFEYGTRNKIVIDSINKRILVNGVATDCNENFDNGNGFNEDGLSEYNPYLFTFNNSGSVSVRTICSDTKIYAYSVKYGNKLSQNFIPCYRKSDSKPGMYDPVAKTFYTNSGTGEFLIGNNVYYDTTNLLESRRRILLTTPHLESPTPANPLIFKSNMTTKLKECKIHFSPVQEGEGDPSPENVRPISGWDGVTLNVNETTITIPFPQTIYGGYVDLVNGEVVEEYYKFTLDGTTHYLSQAQALNANNMAMAYGVIGKNNGLLDLPVGYGNSKLYMVDLMPNYDNGGATSDKEGVFCGFGNPYVRVILDPSKLSDISSSAAIRDSINGWLNDNPIGICYKLATPIHHTIDPQVIRPLKGTNTIYSDANGNIKIKFWKH